MEMEKEHNRQFKKMRTVIKKKSEALVKIDKKIKKNKNTTEMLQTRSNLVCNLKGDMKKLCEQERNHVREISRQERSVYTKVAAGLKPVIVCEFAILREIEQLGPVTENIDKIVMDPFKDTSCDGESISFGSKSNESYSFATPPSTPGGSAMGSRSSSIRSINSFSRSSSESRYRFVEAERFRSRNNSVSSHQVNVFL